MKKQMLGAVMLSAALAIGTAMPAFATEGSSTTSGSTKYDQTYTDGSVKYGVDGNYQQVDKSNIKGDADADGEMDGVATIDDQMEGNSSTPVYIATNIAQINVAVPTKLVFVAESTGGPMMVPSPGVYEVQNFTTKAAIYITDIKAESTGETADWVLVDDNSLVGPGVESAAPRANIMVTMKSATDAASNSANFTVLDNGKNLLANASGDVTPPKIDEAVSNSSNVYPEGLSFDFTATSSVVNDAKTANGVELQAFSLIYTIGTSGK